MSARLRILSLCVLVLVVSPALSAADLPHPADRFRVHNLVSDGSVAADQTDTDLLNPWGIAFNPNGPAWIADNHSGLSTLYNGIGAKQPLVVTIPPPAGGDSPSAPTGIVFSGGSDFSVESGATSAPARFIFATEDGTISGWAPTVDATNAILEVDNSGSGAIYKGLALAGNGTAHLLFATDFHNNKIDVFDDHFQPTTVPGGFHDSWIPAHFAPFGIQNILGNLFVTYAKQGPGAEDDQSGPGFGFVDEFDVNGHLLRRFVARGRLNSPWGVALAPGNFGVFSHSILIGNFGDGRINAYNLDSGRFLGQLRQPDGRTVVIDGLWSIAFGNGVAAQPTDTLFFTAGPDHEEHGVYGRIDPDRNEDHDGHGHD
jgi:uncharacterized protein (TIGR03118 family)